MEVKYEVGVYRQSRKEKLAQVKASLRNAEKCLDGLEVKSSVYAQEIALLISTYKQIVAVIEVYPEGFLAEPSTKPGQRKSWS